MIIILNHGMKQYCLCEGVSPRNDRGNLELVYELRDCRAPYSRSQ